MKLLIVLMLSVAVLAADAFEKVPEAALSALKGVRGKNVSSGYVFVNGHYLTPPYKVARHGTAVFVNDVQVTDQIVSWKGFLATQDGFAAGAASAPAEEEKKPADDLFDAAPAKKEVEAARAKELQDRESAAAANFVLNVKGKNLLKRIDAYRIEVRRKLREGNVCLFGSKYARVMVEPRLAKHLMEFLPEALADAANAGVLESKCRAQGFPFLTRAICEDLLSHREDYVKLIERRRKIREEASIQQLFDNARERQQ